MGAWSETIMGGDSPLDAEVFILRFVGLSEQGGDSFDWKDAPDVLRQALEMKTSYDWEKFLNGQYEREIAAQVIALLHLETGAALPSCIAKEAIKSCEQEDIRIWSRPERRRFYLDHFIDQIKNYNGTPTPIPEEGLFEVIQNGGARSTPRSKM